MSEFLYSKPRLNQAWGSLGAFLPAASRSPFAGIDAGQVQQGDALIQRRDLQFGIEAAASSKGLEAFLEELLVHVGRAQIVEAGSFRGGVRLRMRIFGSGGENRSRGQGNAGAEQETSVNHARNK